MRCAVFVDAGYLYAAGSELLGGRKLPRREIQLDIDKVFSSLRDVAAVVSSRESFLRVYWYDGELRTGSTAEQEQIADTDGVKLRLGSITFAGKQKGVDSLIVTDLIELARNRAIADAVLLSGDEDVRIGVQITQSFGVRVHLLGIEPCSQNQSRLLRQEADSTIEWQQRNVESFLAVLENTDEAEDVSHGKAPQPPINQTELDTATGEFVRDRSKEELAVLARLEMRASVPPDLDRKLLRCAAKKVNRSLDPGERAYVRYEVKRIARNPN